jgi:uncharacterized protein
MKMKKTALITGASSGIGLELAKIHASKGGNLVLVARSTDKLENLKNEIEQQFGSQVIIIAKDLSKQEAPKEVYDQLQQESIHVDYLFNNAGFGDYGFFHETDWDKEAQMIDLNVRTLTHFTKLFIKDMVNKKSGKIMNVASTASFQPGPLMSVYYATKHYVLAFSEGIANELKGTGVTVTALCPGPTASGFQNAAAMNDSKLVKGVKMPSSKEVAEYGYRSLEKGKVVAIHGFMNKMMAESSRFMPRSIVRSVVRKVQEKSK